MKRGMAVLAGLAFAPFVWAQNPAGAPLKGDPAKAQTTATQVCGACHGADGNSTNPAYPSLASQHAAYIEKQLQNYKSGARKNAIMMGMAAPLTPQDMANLGAYFSQKPLKPGTAKNPELVRLGEKIYRGGNAATGLPACAGCHSPGGVGIPAQFPRLAGQKSEYVAQQLQYFRSGERANDAAKMMRSIAAKMSDQDIKAVAEYVSGLQPASKEGGS